MQASIRLLDVRNVKMTGSANRALPIGPSFLWIATCVFLVSSLFVGVPAARADSATTMSATLPTSRDGTSAVWDGSNTYVFGGYSDTPAISLVVRSNPVHLNKIVRYNPTTSTVTTMSALLPTGRDGTSAVWDGSNAYIFGGYDPTYLKQIVRYNPSTNTVATMSATLPTGRFGTSAIWDGSNVYIFGGSGRAVIGSDGSISLSTALNQIVRYNPSTNTVTTMSATLPTPRAFTSAIWDGSNAYIFGGSDTSGLLDEIVRYDPSTNTVTTMSATLPHGRSTSAVWDGSNAYIFGGFGYSGDSNKIVRYTPNLNAVTTMSATLPTGRASTSAASDGSNAYVFGGSGNGFYHGQIVRYNLAPGAPVALAAAAGANGNEVTLNWQPPPVNSYSSPITNYSIYRGTASGSEVFLLRLGNVLTFTDRTTGGSFGPWFYQVRAVNALGESPPSNEAASVSVPDSDHDGMLDTLEPTACAHENSFLESDGSCVGNDWSPPTSQSIMNDVNNFLP